MEKLTADSLFELHFLSNPTLSPDGRHTVYMVTDPDKDKNDYKHVLWLLDNLTGQTRQLTGSGKEGLFLFEDSNTLLFESCRDEKDKPRKGSEKTVFYRMSLDGGEAVRAFEIEKTVTDIRLINQGEYILKIRDNLNALPASATESERLEDMDYHVLEEVPYWANGSGYVSGIRNALYRFVPAENRLEKLTDKYLNVRSFDLKDGLLLYTGQSYTDTISCYGIAGVIRLDSGENRILVPDGQFRIDAGVFSDDGILLAMSDMKSWGMGQMPEIFHLDPVSGTINSRIAPEMAIGSTPITDTLYGSGHTFKALGDDLYFIAENGSVSQLVCLDAEGHSKVIPFDGSVIAFDICNSQLVIVGCAFNRCADLYLQDGKAFKQVTDINADYFARYRIAEPIHIPFTNADGTVIDGWALVPDGSGKHPAVLEIHGGPRCTYGPVFFHEMQVLCAKGYYVFFCNPRGSEGYGEAFADLRGRYGTIDYEDLMAFLDHALVCYPDVDPARLAACGGSYGGFMCNWIEGHTDRFAAIASQRSISNWVSDFGTSEIGLTFDLNEMGADPWTDMDSLWRMSPLRYAGNAKTPILFIHSLCDYNCTVDQGLEMFSAMKYFGVPTRMCLFEGENHSLSRSGKPKHRLRRLREIENWFERYLDRKASEESEADHRG